MISVELNTALKAYFLAENYPASRNIKIFPLSAYDETSAPFILYFEYSGTQSEEQWFLKVANVMYYVYDNNISRMKDIAYQIEQFFNVGDNVENIKQLISPPNESYGGLRYRLTNSRKASGSVLPPAEREGIAAQMLNFRMVYVDV
jgi:hypothetical protein